MSETSKAPRTIGGALSVLQSHPHGFTDQASRVAVEVAAREVLSHHNATEDQRVRLGWIEREYTALAVELVRAVPPGAERSTALQYLRTSKTWASSGVCLEGA